MPTSNAIKALQFTRGYRGIYYRLAERMAVLPPPPLGPSEDEKAYQAMFEEIRRRARAGAYRHGPPRPGLF